LGAEVSLASLAGLIAETEEDPGLPPAAHSRFLVTGIFRCGFYEYDMGWAFIRLEAAGALGGPGDKAFLGVKLQNRWQDAWGMEQIRGVLAGEPPLADGEWRL
jgi:lipoprotein-releasing system permease protein